MHSLYKYKSTSSVNNIYCRRTIHAIYMYVYRYNVYIV